MNEHIAMTPEMREKLETEWLPAWLPGCRWYGGKSRAIHRIQIAKSVEIGGALLLDVEVIYETGPAEHYAVPVALGNRPAGAPGLIATTGDEKTLYDAAESEDYRGALFKLMASGDVQDGVRGTPGSLLGVMWSAGRIPASRVLPAEQSNTSLVFDDRLFMKLYRKLVPGLNPDAEVTRFLTESAKYRHVPAFGGSIEWEGASLALASAMVPNEGDAWAYALNAFRSYMEDPSALRPWCDSMKLLGKRTGEMHCALAEPWAEFESAGDFGLEPLPKDEIRSVLAGVMLAMEMATGALGRIRAADGGELHELLESYVASLARLRPEMEKFMEQMNDAGERNVKIRIHGDYHLGQVLVSHGDFVIIDFEGEPSRSLSERRAKQPAVRDVAGMLRSFHYAGHVARGTIPRARIEDAEVWSEASQEAFLIGWRGAVSGSKIASERLLRLYLLEKVIYEINYELNNRPGWLHIPLRGLIALAQDEK